MRIVITLGLASLALLAGCRSDEQILKEARASGLERCKSQAKSQQGMAGFDTDRFCTCLVDKTLTGKTVAQLENMKEAEQKAAGEKAGAECAMQQMPAGAPAAQGAAAPGAEQAAETGSETVQESADEAE